MARVLVIDDDEEILAIFQSILIDFGGYECDCARNGMEAVNRVLNVSYDLVLIDRFLERGTAGDIVMLALRDVGYSGPAMVVTGLPREIDEEVSSRCGYVDTMIKPVAVNQLLEGVRRALSGVKADA